MKRTAFVGQAMPRIKKDPHDWPGLNIWMREIGVTNDQIKKYFLYTALVDFFPGAFGHSHRIPSHVEIRQQRKRLRGDLISFEPSVVVTVGKLSAGKCLRTNINKLSDIVGRKFSVDPYSFFGKKLIVIPFPHPSGASTWRYQSDNFKLLNKAMKILANELKR